MENILTIDELHNKVELLREYADLEGSELGELNQQLCNLVGGILDYASQEFQDAIAKEISEQLEYFQTHTRIVEEEIKISHTIRELEFLDV